MYIIDKRSVCKIRNNSYEIIRGQTSDNKAGKKHKEAFHESLLNI